MTIAPANKITLLATNIEIDNKHQLTFENVAKQMEYFNNLPKYEYSNITYVRKGDSVVINDTYDNLIKYNYCMYQNTNFSNKWYFAFIIGMDFLSPGSTRVYLKSDPWQTYQFDINFLESFIEREHIAKLADIPGVNLLPEGLEIGEPINNGTAEIELLNPVYVIAYAGDPVEDKVILPPTPEYELSHSVNGVQTGVAYFVSTSIHLAEELKQINSMKMLDKVMTIFTIPALAVLGFETFTKENLLNPAYDHGAWIFENMNTNGYDVTLFSNPSTLDGYNPRNKKLLTYPYLYLGFTAPNGNSQIYKYEDFTNRSPQFTIKSEINPNPQIYFIPKNYKNDNLNVSESGVLQGYPSIGYMTDFYNSWLAQNSQLMNIDLSKQSQLYAVSNSQYINSGKMALVNYGGNLVEDAMLTVMAGIGIGKGIKDTANFQQELMNLSYDQQRNKINYETAISQNMALKEAQKLIPNTATLGSGSTLLGYGLLKDNTFTRFSIRSQFARRIDKYFDMFGYMTNEVKRPNLNNRSNWNYVKTQGANIISKDTTFIPQTELNEIKSLFDNGITLWHTVENFLDYSKDND